MALLGEEGEQVVRRHAAQRVADVEGHLERRRANVAEQHVQVRRIEARLLRRRVEQVVGMGGDELVDRARPGDEDRHADASRRRPERPICCHVAAIVPG